MTNYASLLLIALLGLALASTAGAKPSKQPDPAKTNPAVFFYDDFESGDFSKWDNRNGDFSNPNLKVVTDAKDVFAGGHSLQVTGPVGKETGGSLATWFMPGYDTVYARWYCRFAEDFDQGNFMHFNRLLAGPPGQYFAAFGGAGTRPNGHDRFTTGFEPWRDYGKNPSPGAWAFYSYFPDMKADRQGNYYGNMFFAEPKLVLDRNRWYCIEMMAKANTPGEHDGEQAAWVDGKEVLHVKGMLWREAPELKIHAFRLSLYLHDSPRVNRVWFDNVAVSTKYIGPIDAAAAK
jgi:hypothetical protein